MKRMALVLLAAILCGLALVGWGWRSWTGPGPRPDGLATGATASVRILPGMTLRAAADTLVARGLLKGARTFLTGARITGMDRGLKAGRYEVPYGLSPRELLAALTGGPTIQVRVTLPEGLDVEETAAILAEALGLDPVVFLAVADSLAALAVPWDLADRLEAEQSHLPRVFHAAEGYLAPDTYLFGEGTSATAAAHHLVATQAARLDSVLALRRPGVTADMSSHEILTLASIVEAEARRADERRRIAAVYVNRLEAGRRLEADPTVAFILRKKGKRLYYVDLDTDSAFNTYRRKGLPPGPIASPGLAALEAAARPDTTSRDLFFVSDGEGGHVFSRTPAEHEAAVQAFRRAREAQVRQR
jgi:UPF0755 protein